MKPLNKRLHKGEAAAFAELYDLLGEKLFRYAYSRLGSTQDATDVVQEVFVQLVKSHRSLGRAENLNGYVFATARNETIRWLRRNKRHQHDMLVEQTPDNSMDEQSTDGTDWVNWVLKTLEPVDHEIVHLKALAKLTFKEIADAVGMPQATVATRYRRAMLKLQTQLSSHQNIIEQEQ